MCGTVCSPRYPANSEDTVPDEVHRWWLKRRSESIFIRCEIGNSLQKNVFSPDVYADIIFAV